MDSVKKISSNQRGEGRATKWSTEHVQGSKLPYFILQCCITTWWHTAVRVKSSRVWAFTDNNVLMQAHSNTDNNNREGGSGLLLLPISHLVTGPYFHTYLPPIPLALAIAINPCFSRKQKEFLYTPHSDGLKTTTTTKKTFYWKTELLSKALLSECPPFHHGQCISSPRP